MLTAHLKKISLWEVTKLDVQNFTRNIFEIHLPCSAPIGACIDGEEHLAFAASVYLNAFLVHFHHFGLPAYY